MVDLRYTKPAGSGLHEGRDDASILYPSGIRRLRIRGRPRESEHLLFVAGTDRPFDLNFFALTRRCPHPATWETSHSMKLFVQAYWTGFAPANGRPAPRSPRSRNSRRSSAWV